LSWWQQFLISIGLRSAPTYTMAQIVTNIRTGVWTLAEAVRITGISSSVIEAQLATEGFLIGTGAGATSTLPVVATSSVPAVGGASTGTLVAGGAAALVVAGVIVYVLARAIGVLSADAPVRPGQAMTRHSGATQSVSPATPTAFNGPFGVFLGRNDMFVGQKSVLGALRYRDIIGWGTSDEVVGEAVFRDVLNRQFGTAEEARAAYLDNMVPGSNHPRPLGLGPVAKFRFDGGTTEHCTENAMRFVAR
jgi:hypothetical protein